MSTAAEPISRLADAKPVPLRVFIVEDSPVILEVLMTTLSEMLDDVEIVGTASDEPSVAAWMRGPDAGRADVVIVDLFLAKGSGLSVLEIAGAVGLRARRVVLTNYATPVIRERCRKLGALRVFDKSTELYDLVRFLSEVGPPSAGPSIR